MKTAMRARLGGKPPTSYATQGSDTFAGAGLLDMTLPPPGTPHRRLTAQSNATATLETGEPTTARGFGAGHSVWYKFVAPFTGHLLVAVVSPSFDCFCELVTGTAANSYSVVDSYEANNAAFGKAFSVTAGTTYYLRITGYQAGSGTFTLSWSFNDDLVNATALGALTGSVTGDGYGATVETSEPSAATFTAGSIWFRVKTGATGGSAQFDTIGTFALNGRDSVMAVYTSSSPSAPTMASLTRVAQDDQSGGNTDAKVTMTVLANTDYFIQVMPSYNSNPAGQPYKFNWSVPSVA